MSRFNIKKIYFCLEGGSGPGTLKSKTDPPYWILEWTAPKIFFRNRLFRNSRITPQNFKTFEKVNKKL